MGKKFAKSWVTKDVVKSIFKKVLNPLSNITRWSNKDRSENKSLDLYTELAKQGLNIVITYFLAERAKAMGKKIVMERFPWIALNRMFEKTINGNIRDDHINEICAGDEGLKWRFKQNIKQEILQNPNEFKKRMEINEDWIEVKLFKLGTKIATLIECRELEIKNAEAEVLETVKKLAEELEISFFDEGTEEYKFFCEVSMLRSSIRWLTQFKAKKSSVLEHMAETAIIAFLVGLEQSEDEEVQCNFFISRVFQ